MTIEFKKLFDQGDGPVHGVVGQQTVVYLDGSVGTFTFEVASTEGQAVLLLEDHAHDFPGEPGRQCPDELMGGRLLAETPGVIIATRDPRSLDVVIDALKKIRRELVIFQDASASDTAGSTFACDDEAERQARAKAEREAKP